MTKVEENAKKWQKDPSTIQYILYNIMKKNLDRPI